VIPVAEALERILRLVAPLDPETVPLRAARGRVLAEDAVARRNQPPFDASAMDGYAVRDDEVRPGATFRVIGSAPAGHAFAGTVAPGEAVRIFTGAPVPAGADRVVIQEDVARDGDTIRLTGNADGGTHIRPAGSDFAIGDRVKAPRRLGPADLSLLASMNLSELRVTRRPDVAILCTGDELVMPGDDPAPDQIVASNGFGLAALAEETGARARLLPIARDSVESLGDCLTLAAGADLIVTTGGASVGEHDLMARAAGALGVERTFYKVAMRPGKPLMAGRLADTPLIGLPGNPVSTMVCGIVFVRPALRRLLGLPSSTVARGNIPLAAAIGPNGAREHYMRARLVDGAALVAPSQSSHLQRSLAEADILVVRPPHDPARPAGDMVEFLTLSPGTC